MNSENEVGRRVADQCPWNEIAGTNYRWKEDHLGQESGRKAQADIDREVIQ